MSLSTILLHQVAEMEAMEGMGEVAAMGEMVVTAAMGEMVVTAAMEGVVMNCLQETMEGATVIPGRFSGRQVREGGQPTLGGCLGFSEASFPSQVEEGAILTPK